MNKKCWICGKEATKVRSYYAGHCWLDGLDTFRQYCDECFKVEEAQRAEDKKEYLRLKKSLMFERAIRLMEKQKIDVYDYEEEIKTIKEYMFEHIDKYDSSHEIVAAIILLRNRVRALTQYKVGKYTVDFYIPEYNLVLEIDGDLHKHQAFQDNVRDIEIRKELGLDSEVVRIGTEYIEQNAEMLWVATARMKNYKLQLRKENNGMLPEWFSTRTKAKKPKAVKQGDDVLLDI